ncbi:hypothetical protein Hamer_G029669 [Homarus americanus]|uniref:Uncharacterized protein n=1 Tax=Homarus americanus TaxID=6706 RepID=A0A8J5JW21_HOMAM|nr:hypothetical protein Hamer_G028159 [Homarus americanus]KAG7165255.1 hypothetical protein Hamer_G027724 [Homarus americanus]KAG7168261.1 hypothetical protein Hamer_G031567 [Homarus americanus]KAG7169837.1 hypothetical protein Hamer_G028582 [Homarus americanus]KAG7174560.1 hypothetical protein Hamer_G016465 [Homarus americanus]
MDFRLVRILRDTDVQEILSGTPRRLGTHIRFANHYQILQDGPLAEGEGVLLGYDLPEDGVHCVSLYRCLDGRYLYHDSTPRPMHHLVRRFMQIHNIPQEQVTIVDAIVQGPVFHTCAYHALAFLDIVSSVVIEDSWLVVHHYKEAIRSFFPDELVVLRVFRMIGEFHNTINLTATSIYDSVLPPVH